MLKAGNSFQQPGSVSKPGAVLFLILVALAAAEVRAQSCGLTQVQAVLDEETQRVGNLGGGFCDNNITGSDQCVGNVGKIEFDLELESADQVDLTCTSTHGVLCIMAGDCQGALLGQRLSDRRVRLRGAAPDTNLKILIADDAIQGTLCNNGVNLTVTCAGFYGGRLFFQSGFEGTFEEEGWDTSDCGSCNMFTGRLAAGQSAFTHASGVVLEQGDFRAVLEGSADSEFDLVLWKRVGSVWQEIAMSAGPGSDEDLIQHLPLATYRWEIRAGERGGAYTLRLGGPDLGELDP